MEKESFQQYLKFYFPWMNHLVLKQSETWSCSAVNILRDWQGGTQQATIKFANKKHALGIWCAMREKWTIFMPPFKEEGHLALHLSVGWSVCRSVGRPDNVR
jgi:hypothetical protein